MSARVSCGVLGLRCGMCGIRITQPVRVPECSQRFSLPRRSFQSCARLLAPPRCTRTRSARWPSFFPPSSETYSGRRGLQQKGGSIIMVSSIGGYTPLPGIGCYCVSKTALLGLSKVAPALLQLGERFGFLATAGHCVLRVGAGHRDGKRAIRSALQRDRARDCQDTLFRGAVEGPEAARQGGPAGALGALRRVGRHRRRRRISRVQRFILRMDHRS
jgi:NAD(P)-dependent dehydrogenase (short-subunit alcohol dehydrogenase family)